LKPSNTITGLLRDSDASRAAILVSYDGKKTIFTSTFHIVGMNHDKIVFKEKVLYFNGNVTKYKKNWGRFLKNEKDDRDFDAKDVIQTDKILQFPKMLSQLSLVQPASNKFPENKQNNIISNNNYHENLAPAEFPCNESGEPQPASNRLPENGIEKKFFDNRMINYIDSPPHKILHLSSPDFKEDRVYMTEQDSKNMSLFQVNESVIIENCKDQRKKSGKRRRVSLVQGNEPTIVENRKDQSLAIQGKQSIPQQKYSYKRSIYAMLRRELVEINRNLKGKMTSSELEEKNRNLKQKMTSLEEYKKIAHENKELRKWIFSEKLKIK